MPGRLSGTAGTSPQHQKLFTTTCACSASAIHAANCHGRILISLTAGKPGGTSGIPCKFGQKPCRGQTAECTVVRDVHPRYITLNTLRCGYVRDSAWALHWFCMHTLYLGPPWSLFSRHEIIPGQKGPIIFISKKAVSSPSCKVAGPVRSPERYGRRHVAMELVGSGARLSVLPLQ